MNNLIANQEDLNKLKNILCKIRNKGINNDILEELLVLLIPKKDEQLLTTYKFHKNGLTTASFIPNDNSIKLNVKNILYWIAESSSINKILNQKISQSDLNAYLAIFVIAHETEHCIQFLMANDMIDSPYKLIKEGYKNIFELFNKNDSIIPFKDFCRQLRLFLHKINTNSYILERNANLESMDLLYELGKFEENKNATEMFMKLKNGIGKLGYQGKYNGCLEETYRKTLMYNKYKKFDFSEKITEEERRRYGLPIVKSKSLKRNIFKNQ